MLMAQMPGFIKTVVFSEVQYTEGQKVAYFRLKKIVLLDYKISLHSICHCTLNEQKMVFTDTDYRDMIVLVHEFRVAHHLYLCDVPVSVINTLTPHYMSSAPQGQGHVNPPQEMR